MSADFRRKEARRAREVLRPSISADSRRKEARRAREVLRPSMSADPRRKDARRAREVPRPSMSADLRLRIKVSRAREATWPSLPAELHLRIKVSRARQACCPSMSADLRIKEVLRIREALCPPISADFRTKVNQLNLRLSPMTRSTPWASRRAGGICWLDWRVEDARRFASPRGGVRLPASSLRRRVHSMIPSAPAARPYSPRLP